MKRITVRAFVLYFDTFFTANGDAIPPGTEVNVIKEGEPSVAEVWRVGKEGKKRRSYSQGGTKRVTSFSTGPLSAPTHWKQTIFLLREPFAVNEGNAQSRHSHNCPDSYI